MFTQRRRCVAIFTTRYVSVSVMFLLLKKAGRGQSITTKEERQGHALTLSKDDVLGVIRKNSKQAPKY